MKRRKITARFILYFIIAFFGYETNAQQIAFEYLGLEQGLSQVSVTSMVQDDIGRLWIGTKDGLNLFDGSHIKVFRPIRGDSTSLLDHNVVQLEKDGDHIWVITHQGISQLSVSTLRFRQFKFEGILSAVFFNDKLLLGTNRGLFELNTGDGRFYPRKDIFNESCVIKNLFVDNAGILRICSVLGYYKHDPFTGNTKRLISGKINVAFIDSQKQTWVGTDGNGIILLNRQDEVITEFRHLENKASLVNNIIRDISEDSKGNIWVGTFLGLSIIDSRTLGIENFQQNDDVDNDLSHNSIYCILRDKQGTMWVGTYFGGISYYNPEFHVYMRYPIGEDIPGGVSYHVVGDMLEDKDNNLWIATEGGGLNYLDRETKLFKHYMHTEGQDGLSHNNLRSLFLANKSYLLIGTHLGGLNILDLNSNRFESYTSYQDDTNTLSFNIVNTIIPYKGDYLLGTHQGIIRFNLETREFSFFIEDPETRAAIDDVIFCLFEDSFGNLWIGTESNGLFSYDPLENTVDRYITSNDASSISSNSINCIFEDHLFRLWIGTGGGGLNQFIRGEDRFITYSRLSHQIESDFINGIVESRYGNLWISTSKGLVRFDIDNNRVYNFNHEHGFPLNELNDGAIYLCSDGELFVGGINGLISFKEESLLRKAKDYSIYFTSLFVNNEEIIPGDSSGILQQGMPKTESITLGPKQNILTIHYSSSNYIPSHQDYYEYQLENFNNRWINAGDRTSVTFTNLDPGTYYLHVRIISNIDASEVDAKVLKIIVTPPLYKTVFAYIIYGILLIALLIWINQVYLKRVRLEDSLRAEKRETDKIKELNQSKLRFFTNISHEFRTPLTLITATMEDILEDTKTSAKNYTKLLAINKNAVRLNNLITELLDFRRLEQGFLKLSVSENNMAAFIDEIFQSFVEFANHRHISYSQEMIASSLVLWFDKKQVEKVFYNLISNAFKAVEDHKGEIIIKAIEQKSYVDVIVSDNGPGMKESEINNIFDRYFQIDRFQGKMKGEGSGIGLSLCMGIIKEHHGEVLVDSIEGRGTSFIVRINKGNKHFKHEEIAEAQIETVEKEVFYLPNEIEEYKHSALDQSSPLILIVEDNVEVRALIKRVLFSNYRIIEANDGVEGMDLAIKDQPDLIISDVMMPHMSGTQMCTKLKRNIQTSHIPIILLTARTALEYKIEGIQTGADDYITKPFNTRLLKARVKNLIKNRIQLQQKFSQDPSADIKDITKNPVDQKIIKDAEAIIERFMDDTDFDVNKFAEEMGYGRTRLFSKIKGVTGQTPNEFILTVRLKKAVELLCGQSGMNISEIAYAVGFSTPRYFSRCFKEHFGISPSKYAPKSTALETK